MQIFNKVQREFNFKSLVAVEAALWYSTIIMKSCLENAIQKIQKGRKRW
jgi:hypothetical protein